jgi:hypothetical protein
MTGLFKLLGGWLVGLLSGLREPQGIGYAPKADVIVVTSAADGSVPLFRGEDFTPLGAGGPAQVGPAKRSRTRRADAPPGRRRKVAGEIPGRRTTTPPAGIDTADPPWSRPASAGLDMR